MTPADSPELSVVAGPPPGASPVTGSRTADVDGPALAANPVTGPRVADVDGIPMSALVAEVPEPRAVIVALHGGAVTSRYFDVPDRPRLSLLRTGAALGFTVIALDRPGYGRSAPYPDRMTTVSQRVDLTYAAVERLLAARPRGAGLFLLGHSQGCVLAVQMAADERGAGLLGLEIAGTGREYHPRAAATLGARQPGRLPAGTRGGPRRGTGTEMRGLVWGPGHLYPSGAARTTGLTSSTPPYEVDDVMGWAADFPSLAARIRVPVRYSLGEHEQVWRSGPPALAGVAALFTASPRVAVDEQAGAGHMLSRGLSAAAYHLKVLSFAEECVLAREISAAGRRESPGAAAVTQLAGG